MGARVPKYDCEIVAEGYKPYKFEIWQLYDSPHKSYAETPRTLIQFDDEADKLETAALIAEGFGVCATSPPVPMCPLIKVVVAAKFTAGQWFVLELFEHTFTLERQP